MKEMAGKVKLKERVDVNSIHIRRDHYFPNAYIIDLPLDSTPDHVWQDIFEREWKSSRQIWDRKLFAIGDKLRLITPPTELKEKLNWVKRVIAETNKGIDEYNQEAEVRKERVEKEEKKALEKDEAKVEEIRELVKESLRPI
jgi:hypothetical protein